MIIRKLGAPAPVKITKEPGVNKGYYLVSLNSVHGRSYSWTSIRTPKEALCLALQKSWEVSSRRCGVRPSKEVLEQIEAIPTMDIPGLNRDAEME